MSSCFWQLQYLLLLSWHYVLLHQWLEFASKEYKQEALSRKS